MPSRGRPPQQKPSTFASQSLGPRFPRGRTELRGDPNSPHLALGRVERTDRDVVTVRISERKLRGSSVGIDVWLFFQPADERSRPWQSDVKVVDPKEQEEAVSRLGV